ncbi:hypothetical protein IL306_007859 [Fusarium sp. DS 682]|nr:hypothetical protein IL306_007859 [Fusarium sp. DS 682]
MGTGYPNCFGRPTTSVPPGGHRFRRACTCARSALAKADIIPEITDIDSTYVEPENCTQVDLSIASIEGRVFNLTAMDPATLGEFISAVVPSSPKTALSRKAIPSKFDMYEREPPNFDEDEEEDEEAEKDD